MAGRITYAVDFDAEVANLDGLSEASARKAAEYDAAGDTKRAAYWRGRARGLQLAAHNLHHALEKPLQDASERDIDVP